MPHYSREDIFRMVEEQNVRFIRLQFTDILGQLKNVTIMSSHLGKALDNLVMFDGSSIEGFVRIEESDMYLYPDLDTFCIFPWNGDEERVARLICDVYTPNGKPFLGDPRYALKRAVEQAKSLGYRFNVGCECEFFLFQTDSHQRPTTQTHDDAGYFDLGPLDQGEAARRDICLTLEAMGYAIEYSHHETARGQHEIDFRYDDALVTADNIMTFKLVVKTIAQRHGLHATFMPKPIFGINGSGMHTNMSLEQGNQNAFFDPNGAEQLSRVAYQFLAGLLEHVKAITAITNPLVNSYKRLVPGYEAPCYIAWSGKNRSPLIRVPAARGASTRLELRCPDPTTNPYLALAVCLGAGLDGMSRDLTPPPSIDLNIYNLDSVQRSDLGIESLPGNLLEAIQALKSNPLVIDLLGSHIFQAYTTAKEREWEQYITQVTNWEIDRYLTLYP